MTKRWGYSEHSLNQFSDSHILWIVYLCGYKPHPSEIKSKNEEKISKFLWGDFGHLKFKY